MAIGASQPEGFSMDSLSDAEKGGLARAHDFSTMGSAYAVEHGTRPGTIGLVLSSSPIALLAWYNTTENCICIYTNTCRVGEKYQKWSDQDPPIEEILDSVTLYWFTESFPRSIYPYRQFYGAKPKQFHGNPDYYFKIPFGYSWFPQELAPIPKAWVEKTGNLVWYREHKEGGHFASLEKPELFVKDIEDFVKDVWPTVDLAKLKI